MRIWPALALLACREQPERVENRAGEWILVGWQERYVAALAQEYRDRNTA